MKKALIDKFLNQQDVNGFLEETQGVVFPLSRYDKDDPVAKWFARRKRNTEHLAGEKWDPSKDIEFLHKVLTRDREYLCFMLLCLDFCLQAV